MDRLVEQVVAWHNRHPLAKRISIYDVHTIGVVALPFMRGGRAGAPAADGPIEPVLHDEVSPESIAQAWGSEESTIAANTNAAHLDALADQEAPPPGAAVGPGGVSGLLARLLAFLPGRSKAGSAPGAGWPVFSERFVDGLSARRIAAFAQAHGYSSRPGDGSWPQRVVPIDDGLMTRQAPAGGAWPYELYVMSAAIDAGRSRSRVLIGRGGGNRPPIIGGHCLSPARVGSAALLLLGLLGLVAALVWPRSAHHADEAAGAAASAAASASSAAVVASASASASAPASASSAAPAESAASALEAASAVPLAEAASGSASAPAPDTPASAATIGAVPDIRPHLALNPSAPPMRGADAGSAGSAAKPGSTAAPAPATAPSPAASAAGNSTSSASTPIGDTSAPTITMDAAARKAAALSGKPVVALVGPPTANKAEAEATLAKLRELIGPMQQDPSALQAQVFKTPEGWRAAVWPFASREEAQLINATLVARGMRTKAVNF